MNNYKSAEIHKYVYLNIDLLLNNNNKTYCNTATS